MAANPASAYTKLSISSMRSRSLKTAHALEAIQDASLEAILRGIPGLRMPDHRPPQFVEFEPLPVTGEELPSEQLIRERR